MTDFMQSPFVQACQATLDQEAEFQQLFGEYATRPVNEWPVRLRAWMAEEIGAMLAYLEAKEDDS